MQVFKVSGLDASYLGSLDLKDSARGHFFFKIHPRLTRPTGQAELNAVLYGWVVVGAREEPAAM